MDFASQLSFSLRTDIWQNNSLVTPLFVSVNKVCLNETATHPMCFLGPIRSTGAVIWLFLINYPRIAPQCDCIVVYNHMRMQSWDNWWAVIFDGGVQKKRSECTRDFETPHLNVLWEFVNPLNVVHDFVTSPCILWFHTYDHLW